MKNTDKIDVERLAKELSVLGMPELRARFAEHFGYTSQTRKKSSLVKKILWAVQRDAYGDISDQARKKALSIADDRDVKERFPKITSIKNSDTTSSVTLPYKPDMNLIPGTLLQRHYQGKDIRVLVLEKGFEWDGRYFKSLSAIAREVSGTQWNGKLFFNLKKKGAA
ncbi:MAG: hypothetical protein CML13_06960 [Puniceicoccaceae bacterium]|nr:hypothetical protein [Puniceicoccaceae bacterium]|tara:strand:+ start:23716 stop:24216 length:501 start_codon:yes stop_codon:yes gene_type:complete